MNERWRLEEEARSQDPIPAKESAGESEITLIIVVAVVLAVFLGATAWVFGQAYQTALEAAESRNAQRAQGLDEVVARFLEQSERTAVRVAGDYFRARGSIAGIDADGLARFRHYIGHLDALVPTPLGVVDAEGRLAVVTKDHRQASIERLIRERFEVFRPSAEIEPPSLVVLRPEVSGTREDDALYLCWRIFGAQGDFAVVVAVVDGDLLRSVLAGSAVEGPVGLVTREGKPLLLLSGAGIEGGSGSLVSLLDAERLRTNAFGNVRGVLTAGGPEVLLAFRRIGPFPLVAVAVTSRAEGVRPWRGLLVGGVAIALGLTMLVVVLLLAHLRAVGQVRRNLVRRMRERTLDQRRSAERLLAAERLTHLGHWEHDLLAGCGYWSAETYQIFGLIAGQDYLDLERVLAVIHPGDRNAECTARILASAGVKPYDVSFRILRPDGSIRHVHAQAEVLRDDHGMPVKLIGTILDITERVANECRLREREEKYRKAFEAAQDALFLVDRNDQTIIEANDSAGRVYGGGREDFVALPWCRLLADSNDADLRVQAGTVRHRRRDGREIYVEVSVAAFDFQGRTVEIVAARDVTARVESNASFSLSPSPPALLPRG